MEVSLLNQRYDLGMRKGQAPKTRYLTAEVVKLTGISKRDLLYYDEIGLFSRAGRIQSGARFYQAEDLLRLEQISFYSELGVPLETITTMLSDPGQQDARTALDSQALLLYRQQEETRTRLTALEAFQELIKHGFTPPWGVLIRVIRQVPGADLEFWKGVPAGAEEESLIQDFEGAWEFYNDWKTLILRGAIYLQASVKPEDNLGKALGLDWLRWTRQLEAEHPDLAAAFTRLTESQAWLREDPYKDAQSYLTRLADAL